MKTIEFEMRLDRTSPVDHEVDVAVCAIVRRVRGEPGSLAIQDGWEVEQLTVTEASPRRPISLTASEEEQIEEEVLSRV